MQSHHISVSKTARYFTLGTLNENTEEIWFVIHGFAQLGESFLKEFEPMNNGKRYFIAPEGLNKFYLKAGQAEVGATWMTREDRENEIKDYVSYLNQLFDAIIPKGHPAKVAALGFSQGAATVSRWAFKNQRRIDSLIFFAGEFGNELQNPEAAAQFKQTKKYFVSGTQDQFINEALALKFKELLKGFTFVSFEGKHEMRVDLLPDMI
jgi:predicted esterase